MKTAEELRRDIGCLHNDQSILHNNLLKRIEELEKENRQLRAEVYKQTPYSIHQEPVTLEMPVWHTLTLNIAGSTIIQDEGYCYHCITRVYNKDKKYLALGYYLDKILLGTPSFALDETLKVVRKEFHNTFGRL